LLILDARRGEVNVDIELSFFVTRINDDTFEPLKNCIPKTTAILK
jgi:hypothetical protein